MTAVRTRELVTGVGCDVEVASFFRKIKMERREEETASGANMVGAVDAQMNQEIRPRYAKRSAASEAARGQTSMAVSGIQML